ncbi:MAG: hypothetical protein JST23_08370 [Bacteroidetes bacterium]|nr:hypothetical protein [Bacteroidota bacterium]
MQPSIVAGEPLGVKQGLSQGMINCMYQDKEGYMWICTKDGLNRYDGYQIKIYRNESNDPYSLPDNYCNVTIEDDNGNFWVGTNTKGLYLFEKKTERFYAVPLIFNNTETLCIREIQCNKGKLYLRTLTDLLVLDISNVNIKNDIKTGKKTKLLFSYNALQQSKKYKLDITFKAPYISSFLSDNSIWVSFRDSIFYCKPNVDFSKWSITSIAPTSLGIDANIKGLPTLSLLATEPEIIVIAYGNKIIHFNTSTKKIEFTQLFAEAKNSLFRNNSNDENIYRLANNDVSIYHLKTKAIEVVPIKSLGIPERSIFQVFTSKQDIKWFGSAGYGIAKFDDRKNRFKSYIGANQNEIFWRLSPDYMPSIGTQLKGTWAVLDKQKTYWAFLPNNETKTFYYLYSYNTLTKKTIQHTALPKNCTGYNLYNDSKDRLWIYYQDGSYKNFIARVDKTKSSIEVVYSIPESIESSEPFVSQFYFDDNEILWLATINGLYALNEKNKIWKHWKNIPNNNNSISAEGVLSICPDPIAPEKFFWIGTEGGGVNRFEKINGNCIRYTEKDGLPNNVAYCILSDSLNNLWISTNKGLSCFNPTLKTFQNFTDEDGLPGNEFNRFISRYMQNGELMFGSVDGFVIFNPKEVLQKQPAAPLVFTGISILNKPLNWKIDSSNLNTPIGYAKFITLNPGQNIFSISFATLEYRSNVKKMYKYKLDGFDKDWTNPSSKNEVTYTNLLPGIYTFYVMGANTDGVWNEKPISIKIIIQPYWYQTILFKLLVLLLFVLSLYGFYRYRLKQGLKLEKLRNRIARDLHDEIGSTLSSISIYAASANKVIAGNEKAESILSKINAGTSEVMEAISDIVWAVNTSNDRFENLANRMRAFAVQSTEAKNIELQFTENKDIPHIALNMEQRKNIYLICKEAISNALKYADCSLLQVLITKEQQHLFVKIHDNGNGFAISNLDVVEPNHSFGGNGIKNMKARAVEINASLEIITKLSIGTSIILSIPLKKS